MPTKVKPFFYLVTPDGLQLTAGLSRAVQREKTVSTASKTQTKDQILSNNKQGNSTAVSHKAEFENLSRVIGFVYILIRGVGG